MSATDDPAQRPAARQEPRGGSGASASLGCVCRGPGGGGAVRCWRECPGKQLSPGLSRKQGVEGCGGRFLEGSGVCQCIATTCVCRVLCMCVY